LIDWEMLVSDALDYLLKVRPDAMAHYFRFIKEAGRELDPKTRALISVITKVHAQTEAGFKQYLRRALKDGARPAERLDALLMAFPALGLTKIVWAVDILLRMNLPEFAVASINGTQGWHVLGDLDEFEIAETAFIERDGRRLFVHRSAVEFLVYDARCPHRGTLIPEAALRGSRVTCPRHEWEFEISDGRCVAGGETPLTRLPNKSKGEQLFAYW
jgi:nitrite reductase/ring-hydroxylating ferredoxin subunit/alkylhydroperoxidase/carboxymuconolactone decarboxylase family protein YurZ